MKPLQAFIDFITKIRTLTTRPYANVYFMGDFTLLAAYCLFVKWYYFVSFKRKVSCVLFSAGRIDHGHHDGNAVKALNDGVAMNKAVAKALEMVNKGK